MYDANGDKAIVELLGHLKDKANYPIRVLEIGCGTGARSEYLAKVFPHWEVIASDFCRGRARDLSDSVSYIHQDVHDISFRDDYFDVVFSVAVSEHYSDTLRALQEQYRILKPGGLFYFVHTPFFSCSKGHHAHFGDDHCLIFPPYGHLYLSEDEFMIQALERANRFGLVVKIPEKEIRGAVNRIYNRTDLSRVWHRDFISIFKGMSFETKQWLELDDPLFNEKDAQIALSNLPDGTKLSDLRVEKVRCAAIKSPKI